MRVLVVDDTKDVRDLLCFGLTEMGHDCTTARTAAEARAALANGNFEVMVADAGLPDGNGADLVADADARQVRSVVMTGNPVAMKLLDIKHIPHLRKPFSFSELASAIDGRIWAS